MKVTKFPDVSGDVILDLVQTADGVDFVQVDANGDQLNILVQFNDGGGHVQASEHALDNPDGWETFEDEDSHLQYVIFH